MKIIFLRHARQRMELYGIAETQVMLALTNPDSIEHGHSGRSIAQKRINDRP